MNGIQVIDEQAEPRLPVRPRALTVLGGLVRDGEHEEVVTGPNSEYEGRDLFIEARLERAW